MSAVVIPLERKSRSPENTPGSPHVLKVRSRLPSGRLRIYIAALYRSPELCRMVAERGTGHPAVTEALAKAVASRQTLVFIDEDSQN